jgi:hypothetical protein
MQSFQEQNPETEQRNRRYCIAKSANTQELRNLTPLSRTRQEQASFALNEGLNSMSRLYSVTADGGAGHIAIKSDAPRN